MARLVVWILCAWLFSAAWGQQTWLIDGHVVAPVRATVEGLGGTVRYEPARRALTITLAGQTHHYAIGTDAEYPNYPYTDFWMQNGVTHYPLVYLCRQFNLPVTWDNVAKTAVISTREPARTLTLATRPLPPLTAPMGGVHPLLAAYTREDSYLIGGLANRRYLDDTEIAPYVGRTTYTLYTMTARLGTRRAGGPYHPESDAAGEFVRLDRPVNVNALGIAADWNGLPRTPRVMSPDQEAYRQIARAVLGSYGIENAQPRVTQAVEVDLDGNGTVERLISATTPRREYTESPQAGDYSFVAVESGGRTRVLTGTFFPDTPATQPLPNIHSIGGILDVDGDGRMEVIVHYIGYEWSGDLVYRVTPDRLIHLFYAFTGGI